MRKLWHWLFARDLVRERDILVQRLIQIAKIKEPVDHMGVQYARDALKTIGVKWDE